jgi:peroxiredoxin
MVLTSSLSANEASAAVKFDECERHRESRTQRRVIWAMTVILGISLVVNVLLAYRIRQGNQSGVLAKSTKLLAGVAVPPIKAESLDGREETISTKNSSQPLVIYVFTPQCIWCKRNLANLQMILTQKRDSYRFIALSLTDKDLKQYIAEKQINIPVFFNPGRDAIEQYGLGSTPQTIVVSPDGKVLQNWIGAYVGSQQAEVEKFFGVSLPGLNAER